mmetsp:Transcript_113793/g.332390  ORF Transcript_113793/g.332390 Transcript_113793/m.332390 type:complete len:206 (-) Transcript_113793:944-1561(-)
MVEVQAAVAADLFQLASDLLGELFGLLLPEHGSLQLLDDPVDLVEGDGPASVLVEGAEGLPEHGQGGGPLLAHGGADELLDVHGPGAVTVNQSKQRLELLVPLALLQVPLQPLDDLLNCEDTVTVPVQAAEGLLHSVRSLPVSWELLRDDAQDEALELALVDVLGQVAEQLHHALPGEGRLGDLDPVVPQDLRGRDPDSRIYPQH